MLSEFLRNLFFFALHVDNSAIFPKPLSKSDEQKYFELMADGDKSARNLHCYPTGAHTGAPLQLKSIFKATPHNYRLTAMCVSCLNFFRHSTQKLLVMRPKEVPLGYDSIPASFLCTLTKNLLRNTHTLIMRYCLKRKRAKADYSFAENERPKEVPLGYEFTSVIMAHQRADSAQKQKPVSITDGQLERCGVLFFPSDVCGSDGV